MKSLVDLLRGWADQQPEHLAYLYLREGEIEEARLTYGELDEKARAIAATLQRMGAEGERALLLYHQGLDFIAAFFGCLYAGVTAVPVYPPKMNRNMMRLEAIATDATPKFSLTTGPIWSRVAPMLSEQPELQKMQWLATDEVDTALAAAWEDPHADEETLAFIQYTSGSTGTPKGVMVSHGNLLHNEAMITEAFSQNKNSLVLGWLPLYHDMGLIGNVLQPLYVGTSCILMSPVDFLQHPIRWLQAISTYRATTSGGPNFAYELCARKVTPEQIAALDLSSWTVAFNGAEPINPDVLDLFAETFAPSGFRKEAFFPCYGLAEATLFVTGGAQTELPIVKAVEKEALNGNRVVFSAEQSDRTQPFVSSGHSFMEQRVLIVNPETGVECPADHVGEIWVKGPSAAKGYWQKPELSEATFAARIAGTGEGPFLRTGDLGFMQDGELYVTGRLKDLIIIRGRNHYPQDIENTVAACHPALKPGAGAAFSVAVNGEERLVLVQEVERAVWRSVSVEEVSAAIRQAVAYHHELQVHAVVLIKPASIPKTSSGKIQRHACRNQFLDGSLSTIASDVLESDASAEIVELSREELLALPDAERAAALTRFLTGACAAVIGVTQKHIVPEQSLHALGMDSLMAVELKHRVEESFGVELTMGDVLDGPSVEELTALIQERIELIGQENESDAPGTLFENVTEFPLSYGQKALYFMQSINPHSAAYNISKALRIALPLDEKRLQAAFSALLARHPQLRVTFEMQEDQPVQRVAESAEAAFAFDVQDAAELTEEQLLAEANAEANRPFDLKKGPLLRMKLWKRSETDHLLLIAAHHIAVDFWSFGVLLKEFGSLYADAEHDIAAEHSDRYFEYVSWQQELLQGAAGQRLKAFWQQQLSGQLPVLNLPSDRNRPAVLSERGAALSFELPQALTEPLKALAKETGTTLYAVLLAAFQALLHRYTGQEDIVVGSPSAGRSAAKFSGTVGYFVNPVVLRSHVSADAPFVDFVESVRNTVRDALKHQDYPFPLLVEELQPGRDPSYPPLFNVMFNLQSGALWKEDALVALALGQGGAKLEAGGLLMESVALTQEYAQFDLSLMMGESDGKLSGVFEYSTALFEQATVERISGHFATLLGGIAEDASRTIADLPLLTPLEQELLPVWNGAAGSPSDATLHTTLHALVEAQVERTPNATAVVFEGASLTFAELNARANRTARALQAHGVSADVPVGICMDRSLELVVALLAVLKAGGAYVPLDPSYPQERLAWIAEDTQVPVVLTQSALVATIPAQQAKRICLDTDTEMLNAYEEDNLKTAVEPHHLAYILYTSGSTGRPKGVEIPHRAIVNHMHWMLEAYPMGSTDKILQKTPIGFDASVWEFWAPLLSGATLIMARPGGHRDSGYLAQAVKEHGITVLQLVPTMLGLLLEEPELAAGTDLKHVFCGGEALPVDLQTRFFQVLDAGLHNLYGPTECTIDATVWDCQPGHTGRSVPIGRPITNTQVHVLDAKMRPVPALTLGELHIGGAGLARGYHNRPDLTAEKFIPHPNGSGELLYKTGDLARFLPDGTLEYAGRLDHQVKIRGFRIELGEIEAVLKEHPDVRDAIVTAYEEHGDQRLAAYLIASGTPDADLRGFVKQKLPDYMIPSAFIMLEAFPLLPNGKVDLKSLPTPSRGLTTAETPYIAPATPTEEKLAEMWQEVLGAERIGTADNFFERGGHSLMAMQIVTRVRRQFGVELPVARLFETPTIAQLAAVIDVSGAAPAKPKKPGLSKLSRAAHRIDS